MEHVCQIFQVRLHVNGVCLVRAPGMHRLGGIKTLLNFSFPGAHRATSKAE